MKVRGKNYQVLRLVFKADWAGKIALSQDHSQYRWFSLEEAKTLNTIAGTKKILELIK
jgi:hypothetical protein